MIYRIDVLDNDYDDIVSAILHKDVGFYPSVLLDFQGKKYDVTVELSREDFKNFNDIDFKMYQTYIILHRDGYIGHVNITEVTFTDPGQEYGYKYYLIFDALDNKCERLKQLMES